MKKAILSLIVFSFLYLSACSDDVTTSIVNTETGKLTISLERLPLLSDSTHYAVWIFGKDSVKLDNFKVTANSASYSKEYNVKLGHIQGTKFVAVTIEHDSSTRNDSVSRGIRFLAGSLFGNNAALTVKSEIAFNNDFSTIAGKYALFTPTDNLNPEKRSGIWFVNYTDTLITPGLTLPALPSGWEYNAWIDFGGTVLATGGFRVASTKDFDSTYCGPLRVPSYPGEDFLRNAPTGLTFPINLSGKSIKVTIQPQLLKLKRPFGIELLKVTIPTDAVAMKTYVLEKNIIVPSGNAAVVF